MRFSRLVGQPLGSHICCTSKENEIFTRHSRDLVPSFNSTLAQQFMNIGPTLTSTVAFTYKKENSLFTSTTPSGPTSTTFTTGIQPYLSSEKSVHTFPTEVACADASGDNLGDEILKRLRILREQPINPSTLSTARHSKFLTGQAGNITKDSSQQTEEIGSSECKNISMAACYEKSEVKYPAMDSVSEAMSILLTMAISSDNFGVINSFIEEIHDTMRLNTMATTSVTSDISEAEEVAEDVFELVQKGKPKRNLWNKLKSSLLG